jgi:hypothetical protein
MSANGNVAQSPALVAVVLDFPVLLVLLFGPWLNMSSSLLLSYHEKGLQRETTQEFSLVEREVVLHGC